MVRWCTYPNIHFFVSISRSVVECARVQAFVCVVVCDMCDVRGGVCMCMCIVVVVVVVAVVVVRVLLCVVVVVLS